MYKDLNYSMKKNLRDDNNLRINNASHNYKFKSRYIHFSYKNFRHNEKFIRYQFATNRRKQLLQKKSDLDALQSRTYKLLYENIFHPLEENISGYELNDTQLIPCYKFDPSNIQNNKYFPEGLAHLEKDIENFDGFKEIKDLINTYNEQVTDFEKNKLNELIKAYLEAYGFFTKDEYSTPNRMNEIVIPILSKFLKNYWSKKDSFYTRWDNDYIIIRNEPVAKIAKEDLGKFEERINILKEMEDGKIKEEILNFYCYHNKISEEIIKLSNHIKKITMEMEKGTYRTTCKYCKYQ